MVGCCRRELLKDCYIGRAVKNYCHEKNYIFLICFLRLLPGRMGKDKVAVYSGRQYGTAAVDGCSCLGMGVTGSEGVCERKLAEVGHGGGQCGSGWEMDGHPGHAGCRGAV